MPGRLVVRERPADEESDRGSNRERWPRIASYQRLDIRHHPCRIVGADVLGAAAESIGRRTRDVADGLAPGQAGSFVMKR